MGLFDLFKKFNDAVETKTEELNKGIDNFQKKITSAPLDLFNSEKPTSAKATSEKQSRTSKQIIKRFYADYPEIPYISNDRPKDWIERAEMFPKQCIIPVEMMKRYTDNLLPGHIYMLYWLKKYTNKKVPAYFEYKYGIDFEKEKEFLCSNGYLNEKNKPTEKGEAAIQRHAEVIDKHTQPKPSRRVEDISGQILAARDNILANGFKKYEFIANSNCCEVCAKLDGKHFPVSKLNIGVNAPPMHEGCSCAIAAYEDS
jgi:SPP1 gp7 family putative phage head morphogenesis protein